MLQHTYLNDHSCIICLCSWNVRYSLFTLSICTGIHVRCLIRQLSGHTVFLYKRGGIGLHRNTQCTHRLHMQNETCNMIYATTQSSYSAKPSAQFWMQAHYSLSHYWPEKGKCQQQLSCTYLIQFNMIVICHCNTRTLGA